MSDFIKNDHDKPRADLIPPLAIMEVARLKAYGAKKYSAWNYLHGAHWSRYAGALLRHMFQWLAGEDIDKESGFNHMVCVAANALILLESIQRNVGTDDRAKVGQPPPSSNKSE